MQQFFLIFKLQLQLFKNSLRNKANRFELAARIIFGIVVLVFDLAIASVLTAIVYFFYSREQLSIVLLFILSGIMFYWQIVPLMTASFGNGGVSISRLRFYPISNSKLFLLDLFTGITDPVALSIYLPLMGIFVGVVMASPSSALWAVFGIVSFVLFNASLSRLLQKWMERLLSNRRIKEIIAICFFLLFMGASLAPQILIHMDSNKIRAGSPAPKNNGYDVYVGFINDHWDIFGWTPPGLIVRAIGGARREPLATQAGLVLATMALPGLLLAIGYRRMLKEFYGKGSSATANPLPARSTASNVSTGAAAAINTEQPYWGRFKLDSPRGAIFEKELRYFFRSPRTILVFISAVMLGIVILFPIVRQSAGKGPSFLSQFMLAGVSFYSLMIFAQIFNNSFGYDSHGAKLFYLTPVRGRDVLIGKNLAIAAVIALQTTLTLIIFHLLLTKVTVMLVVNTVVITALALLWMLLAGNFLSVLYPKAIDFSKMGGMAYSKIAMLLTAITQGIIFSAVAIGPFIGWWFNSILATYLVFAVEMVVIAFIYNYLLNLAGRMFEQRPDQFFKSLI